MKFHGLISLKTGIRKWEKRQTEAQKNWSGKHVSVQMPQNTQEDKERGKAKRIAKEQRSAATERIGLTRVSACEKRKWDTALPHKWRAAYAENAKHRNYLFFKGIALFWTKQVVWKDANEHMHIEMWWECTENAQRWSEFFIVWLVEGSFLISSTFKRQNKQRWRILFTIYR